MCFKMKLLVSMCFWVAVSAPFIWANDLGKEVVGRLEMVLYYGVNDTSGDTAIEGEKVDSSLAQTLRNQGAQKFEEYYILGVDQQPIFKSYENWLSPLKPSEEILLSFEPNEDVKKSQLLMDLELWQSRKKIMKTAQKLQLGLPLYIYGPQWRGGRLIVAVRLVELTQ